MLPLQYSFRSHFEDKNDQKLEVFVTKHSNRFMKMKSGIKTLYLDCQQLYTILSDELCLCSTLFVATEFLIFNVPQERGFKHNLYRFYTELIFCLIYFFLTIFHIEAI